MTWLARLAPALALLLFSEPSQAEAPRADYVNNRSCDFYGMSFCLRTWHRYEIIANGAFADFFIYSIQDNGKILLGIYEGNAAQSSGDDIFLTKLVGGATIRFREYNDGEAIHTYYINDRIGFPSQIHMWRPVDLTEEQLAHVKRVQDSFRYCRPKKASMICN